MKTYNFIISGKHYEILGKNFIIIYLQIYKTFWNFRRLPSYESLEGDLWGESVVSDMKKVTQINLGFN
jgi:hypothetical protein